VADTEFKFSVDLGSVGKPELLSRLDATRAGPFQTALKQAEAIYLGFIRKRYISAARGDGTWQPLSPSTIAARLRKGDKGAADLRAAKRKLGNARFLSEEMDAREAIGNARARRKVELLRRRLGKARSLSDEMNIRDQIRAAKERAGDSAAVAKSRSKTVTSLPAGSVEILRDTGLLFNSLSDGSPGFIQQLNPLGITVGSNINYASYHQQGDGVPKREILVPPEGAALAEMGRLLSAGVVAEIQQMVKAGAV